LGKEGTRTVKIPGKHERRKKMNTMKSIWEDAKMNAGYEICVMKSRKPNWLLILINLFWTIWFTARTTVLYQICLYKGHDLVDEGDARPNGGAIDMVCQRCGWSSFVRLY
jgi:hypothetical protein